MRLKNVRGAKGKIESSKYCINDPFTYKGTYQKLFNNNHPIYIEVGMGKGQFIIENAIKYPDINFIGIEKFDSVIVRAIDKLNDLDLPNLRLIRFDAIEITNAFDHEISLIYLNFSDPWPKVRHANRRLTSSIFLDKYDLISKGKPHIIQKTDNRGLFEYSVQSMVNYGYQINNIALDLYATDIKDNIQTEYEERFVKKGNLIYMIDVIKK